MDAEDLPAVESGQPIDAEKLLEDVRGLSSAKEQSGGVISRGWTHVRPRHTRG